MIAKVEEASLKEADGASMPLLHESLMPTESDGEDEADDDVADDGGMYLCTDSQLNAHFVDGKKKKKKKKKCSSAGNRDDVELMGLSEEEERCCSSNITANNRT